MERVYIGGWRGRERKKREEGRGGGKREEG